MKKLKKTASIATASTLGIAAIAASGIVATSCGHIVNDNLPKNEPLDQETAINDIQVINNSNQTYSTNQLHLQIKLNNPKIGDNLSNTNLFIE